MIEQHLAWKLEERTLRIEELRVFRPALPAPARLQSYCTAHQLCTTARVTGQEALAKSRRELEVAAEWEVEGA